MGSNDPSAGRFLVDVAGAEADAATLDVLARLQLVARRCGFELWLSGSSTELRELIGFAGLDAVLPEDPQTGEPLGLEPRR
jgi:hypothetical protein